MSESFFLFVYRAAHAVTVDLDVKRDRPEEILCPSPAVRVDEPLAAVCDRLEFEISGDGWRLRSPSALQPLGSEEA